MATKPLEIEFTAKAQSGNYSWRITGKCGDPAQLRAMKAAIDTYLDMKIDEADGVKEETA